MSDAVRIQDMPDLGAVTDSSSFVGEHAGSGRFAATALQDYLGGAFLPVTGGTVTANLGTASYTAAVTVNATSPGSGVNGPYDTQMGFNVQNIKANWTTTSTAGEVDGILVYCRQGGANSDCGGILVNVANRAQSYLVICEAVASTLNPGLTAIDRQIHTYLGSIDPINSKYYGLILNSEVNNQTSAILLQNNAVGSYWGNAIVNSRDGVQNFVVTDHGDMTASSVTINSSGPTIRSGTGAATGTQPAGSLWLRTDGATGSRLYVSAGAGTWAAVAGV